MSTTTITVNLADKTATYSGDMCIRDSVQVVLIGATASDVAGIIMRILKPDDCVEMAKCDSFSADGDNFEGNIDLSGAALMAEFTNDEPRKFRSFMLQVWNNTASNQSLLINERIYIMNNVFTASVEAGTITEN